MDIPVGNVALINGVWMKHLGGGRFEPAPAPGEVLAKRFDAGGGALSGQAVQVPPCI